MDLVFTIISLESVFENRDRQTERVRVEREASVVEWSKDSAQVQKDVGSYLSGLICLLFQFFKLLMTKVLDIHILQREESFFCT